MNEKDFERILKTIDKDVLPPRGLKEKMLERILDPENNETDPEISKAERLIFERPLRCAFALSAVISGIIWAAMGNGYTGILSGLIGIR